MGVAAPSGAALFCTNEAERTVNAPNTRILRAIVFSTLIFVVMLSVGGGFVFHSPWIIVVALASMVFIGVVVLLVLRMSGVTELKKPR